MTLATDLRTAGLTVVEYDGWLTRGGGWFDGRPTGVMHHHTALPVPYPPARLVGDRLKANINTKPDGTVILLARGACNFSSGPGSSVVLNEVRRGVSPTANAKTRGLQDDMNGNPFFFNFENDHAGTGGPIPQVQLDAIVTATQVVLDHYGLTVGNVISHAEWTARKSDPFWNGDRRCIEQIRSALSVPPREPLEDDEMTPAQEAKLDEAIALLKGMPVALWKYPQKDDPAVTSTFQMQLRTYLAQLNPNITPEDLDAAVAEIIDAMPDDIQVDVRVTGPS